MATETMGSIESKPTIFLRFAAMEAVARGRHYTSIGNFNRASEFYRLASLARAELRKRLGITVDETVARVGL